MEILTAGVKFISRAARRDFDTLAPIGTTAPQHHISVTQQQEKRITKNARTHH